MQLSPELVQQIQEAIANGTLVLGNPSGRTPVKPRQLHDLTLLPTKDDARPTFFWSAEKPRNVDVSHISEFPKLMWHPNTGQEITVISTEAQAERVKFGYVFTSPLAAVLDPMEELQKQFALMSPEDQAAVMRATSENRVETLVAQLAKLDADQANSVFETATKARKRSA